MSLREFANHMAALAAEHRAVTNAAQEQMADLYQELADHLTLYCNASQFCDSETKAQLEAKFKAEADAIVARIEEHRQSRDFEKTLKYFVASGMEGSAKEIADRMASWGVEIDPSNIGRYKRKDPS